MDYRLDSIKHQVRSIIDEYGLDHGAACAYIRGNEVIATVQAPNGVMMRIAVPYGCDTDESVKQYMSAVLREYDADAEYRWLTDPSIPGSKPFHYDESDHARFLAAQEYFTRTADSMRAQC